MNNKNGTIILIVILSVLVIALTSFMFYAIFNTKFSGKFNFSFKDKSVKVLEEEYSLENINEIYLNFKDYDINVNRNESDKLRVVVYSDKDKPLINLENNKISISDENESSICFGICFSNNRIELYVPEDYNKLLNLNTISGDVMVNSNFDLADLNINSVSGDIEIMNAKVINLKTTSGDVLIGNVTDLNVSTVSGDISIDSVSKSLKVKTTSGDVEISKIDLLKDGSVKTISGDVSIRNSNVYVDGDTTSGDINIRKNDDSEFILDVSTVSGDINVN